MPNRRDMLKIAVGAAAGIALGSTRTASAHDEITPGSGTRWSELLGWKVGCHVYSFNRYTFEEGVKKNVQTGCRFLEVFPGMKLTAEGGAVGPDMSKDEKKTFFSILAKNGCVCTTIGVASAERKMFEFCAEMGIGVINAEPKFHQLEDVAKMCEEYNIKVALHNHPKPSIYWDYNTVLERLKDLPLLVGACADIGHWMRSDIKPLDAIKALKGRIIGFHFKDLNGFGKEAHDVPWGTGQADVPAILRELADQKFKGCFSAEYEYNWENSVPEIFDSIKFFDGVAKEIRLA